MIFTLKSDDLSEAEIRKVFTAAGYLCKSTGAGIEISRVPAWLSKMNVIPIASHVRTHPKLKARAK